MKVGVHMPFSKQTIDFLAENRLHNSKEWYQEHKPVFQEVVLQPFQELVEKLSPTMLKIDPQLILIPKVDKTISRIYRDTRFSKDKSLYREIMWCVFIRDKKLYQGLPCFFFELSPNQFRYGCGYYEANTKSMAAIRELILENGKSFRNAFKSIRSQAVFQIEGDRYKRSKAPEQDEAVRDWIDRKSICFIHNSTDSELLFSSRLWEKLAADFLLLKPVYDFLWLAESRVLQK